MTSEVPKIKLVLPFRLEAMGVPNDSLVKIMQSANDKIKNSTEVAKLKTRTYLLGPSCVLRIDNQTHHEQEDHKQMSNLHTALLCWRSLVFRSITYGCTHSVLMYYGPAGLNPKPFWCEFCFCQKCCLTLSVLYAEFSCQSWIFPQGSLCLHA